MCVLRDSKGDKVMDLEKADLSRLETYGWRPPETFSVKAADGVTELYGNMWKPFDFDPKKKYPIVAHVYPGPQTEGVVYRFSAYSTNIACIAACADPPTHSAISSGAPDASDPRAATSDPTRL